MYKRGMIHRGVLLRRAAAAGLLLLALVLCGCGHGSGLSGKYAAAGNISMVVEFKPASKAYITLMGTTIESDYTVDDDKITFKNVNGSDLVMTLEKDGTITAPMGMTLKKED